MIRTDILIVGGGPAGMTLALELPRFDVRAILVNENAGTAEHPRADLIGARTMEHFRRIMDSESMMKSSRILSTIMPRSTT